jgi:hypothetical protein
MSPLKGTYLQKLDASERISKGTVSLLKWLTHSV